MPRAIRIALIVQGAAIGVLLTVALDQYAHKRVEQLGGVNTWGYRGPVMRQKQPNEIRVAFVGGSYAFGWGVAASETVPPTVRQLVALAVDRPGRPLTRVTAVNLGAMGLPLRRYAARLEHFAYLEPDVICVYLDPSEPSPRPAMPTPDSGVTALTGYVPMLPLVLQEKGIPVVGGVLALLDRGLYRIAGGETARAALGDAEALSEVTERALGIARGVVIAIPPARATAERQAQLDWLDEIEARFGTNPRIRVVDLGVDPLLYDPALRLDGVNFSTAGHARVAELVSPAVLELLTNSRS